MRLFILLSVLFLSACATSTTMPYYTRENYTNTGATTGARLTFDEAKAVCRERHLKHEWIGDTLVLDKPNYAACMNDYGYQYNGQ